MKKGTRKLIQALLVLAIVAAGAAIFIGLVASRKAPPKEQRGEIVTPVKIAIIEQIDTPVTIRAAGTVLPARHVDLRPQVSGPIVAMSDALQPGGFFRQGELMARIDPRDYEFAVSQRKAEVARARLEVEQEQGRQAIAEREWALLGEQVQTDERGKALALRKPQLRSALAALQAAESSLAQAELNLERTEIRAPFNAVVLNENVDEGQLVNPQTLAASLAGSDRYWVRASVPLDRLGMIENISESPARASKARVIYQAAGKSIVREGFAMRLLGDLDEAGRMARVLIAVDDPLGLDADRAELPLLIDAFVRVELEGRVLKDVFTLPAEAVREGDRVWAMDRDDRLEIRNIDVVWREETRVLARGGLANGDRVVVSRIGAAAPGMKLRIIDEPRRPDPPAPQGELADKEAGGE